MAQLEKAGRLWIAHDMAKAWRSWRVKAKSKHVAKIQGPGFLRLVACVEAILPCLPLCFAVLPPLFEVCVPCVFLWPLHVCASAYWLRCATVPPSLFFFGVAASEFPQHPLLGHILQAAVWVGRVAWAGHWEPSALEAALAVTCLVCGAALSALWARLVWLQLGARSAMRAALSGSGMHMQPHVSTCQALSTMLPVLPPVLGVQRVSDVPFAPGHAADEPLLCDVWRPRGAVAGAPALLYMHGGAWILGDKYSTTARPLLRSVAAAGYIVVSINYRLAPRASLKEQLQDCKRALVWMRTHPQALELGLTPGGPVVVGGESAGAHLAMCLAFTQGRPAFQPSLGADTTVQGVLDIFGPSRGDALLPA